MAALVDQGVVPGGYGSYLQKSLNDGGLMVSKSRQAQLTKVAIQMELQRVIRQMKGIRNAFVIYDVQEDRRLNAKKEYSASVSVGTTGGSTLDDGKVSAIQHDGRGLFAAALTTFLPALPVEEEGRLTDPAIRENFIERVFLAARWRAFVAPRPRPRDLVAFHSAHKFAVLAHSPAHYARLGRMVAAIGRVLSRAQLEPYHALLMEAFAVRATRGRHANVLQHAAGYFKRDLAADERAELVEVIDEYRRGLVPLVVPLTLVKHHVRRLRVSYLADQIYLSPHPKELMLRNHV
jgi:uncharacterized protein YbgA (DUF1722 family)